MSFIYEAKPQDQVAKPACCDADAATTPGPSCDPVTGKTTADPTKLCCEKAEKVASEGTSSGCCG